MTRFSILLTILAMAYVKSFTPVLMQRHAMTRLTATEKDEEPVKPASRGVSIDMEGFANIWAVEPKMEVESKSSEDKTQGTLLAVGGLGVVAAAAALILTNLPDPNQF